HFRLDVLVRRTPASQLFPYTTLFRSAGPDARARRRRLAAEALRRGAERLLRGPVRARDQRLQRLRQELPEIRAGRRRAGDDLQRDRKSTRLNSSHVDNSYAVVCSKKK